MADLADGTLSAEAEAHFAECVDCQRRFEDLRRVLSGLRLETRPAPDDLIARAKGLMAPPVRRTAWLLRSGFAGGARVARADDFSLLVGTDDVEVQVGYRKEGDGWAVLGRVPEGWSVLRDEVDSLPGGRFRFQAASLDDAGFVLRKGQIEIVVPSAQELIDGGS